jgi:hypothetical protein
MISRKTLFSILLGVVGVLIMTWRIGLLPARIVIINQSGAPVTRVAITTDAGRIDVGAIDNGQTRRVSVNPTSTMRLSFEQDKPYVWSSPKGLNAGQSLVLYVAPEGKIDARDRLGTFDRGR